MCSTTRFGLRGKASASSGAQDGHGKYETRAEFEQRLDRTARRLPEAFINNAIGNLQKRCKLLYEANGGLFEEGGRSRRAL